VTWKIYIMLPLFAAFSIASYVSLIQAKDSSSSEMMAEIGKSVYMLYDSTGRGTGWIVKGKSGNKYMMTNGHVCEDSENGMMTNKDGQIWDLTIRFRDPYHDICLLDAPPKAIPLKVAKEVVMEESAYIVGFPAIQFMSIEHGLIKGYDLVDMPYPVSLEECRDRPKLQIRRTKNKDGKDVDICVFHGQTVVTTIVTDAGASGSPIVNEDSEVIGMVMIAAGNIPWAQGVPLSEIKRVLDSH
jgi:S1-C subfamily serine protease